MIDSTTLVTLGRSLREQGYAFVTVTPETHRRVLSRTPPSSAEAPSMTDVFGWNRAFSPDALPAPLRKLLHQGALLEAAGEGLARSRVRFSTLGPRMFAHSAFPTDAVDAVFFGPDTYRFCRAIEHAAKKPRVVVDVGCGSGAGGLVAGREAETIVLADVSDRALAFARINAEINGATRVELVRSDVLASVGRRPDLVVANPPYLLDAQRRTYRDGGGSHGEALAVRIVAESLDRLAPEGTLLLYTGAAIVNGEDTFLRAATPLLSGRSTFRYEEIDPDVFGEELSSPAYAAVDRIAAVLLEVTVG